jgi:hypothetical protein
VFEYTIDNAKFDSRQMDTNSRTSFTLNGVTCVESYSKYIMIMPRTIKLPIVEGNGIAKHDQHVAVAFQ